VVDLASGAVSRRELPKELRGLWIEFARRSETTGRYVVGSKDDWVGGKLLAIVSPDLREVIACETRDVPFLDAAFSPDGESFVVLTSDGFLRIYEGAKCRSLRRSDQALPVTPIGMHGASIAGWR
jgi:hypothetical protein